jgi:phosphoribosylaminoimidazole-succinocarboxamide synthase
VSPAVFGSTLARTDLPGLTQVSRGKVRDIFEVGEYLLIVCTDRLSAFDVVLPDPIPDKGRVLTQLSRFWFDRLRDVIPNHVVATDVAAYPTVLQQFGEVLAGRSMLARRAKPLPVECIVRGYLAGSGWNDYQRTATVCGIRLPAGLRQADRLPEPLFTPSTKATSGHDENISEEQMADLVGSELTGRVRRASIELYRRASEHALARGLIIADTKFEFGLVGDELIWIDEAFTPDSSRFWGVVEYRVGSSPPSFDKQFVRDHLIAAGWDRKPPAPRLPQEVISGTAERYREAHRLLTGGALG